MTEITIPVAAFCAVCDEEIEIERCHADDLDGVTWIGVKPCERCLGKAEKWQTLDDVQGTPQKR